MEINSLSFNRAAPLDPETLSPILFYLFEINLFSQGSRYQYSYRNPLHKGEAPIENYLINDWRYDGS